MEKDRLKHSLERECDSRKPLAETGAAAPAPPLEDCGCGDGYAELEAAGLRLAALAKMPEAERRSAIRAAGLNPDEYKF